MAALSALPTHLLLLTTGTMHLKALFSRSAVRVTVHGEWRGLRQQALSASQGPHRLLRPSAERTGEAVRGAEVPQHSGEGGARHGAPAV